MEKIRIKELERYMGAASELRPLGPALGAENVAIFYYELDPGDSLLWGGIFRYEEREELCYIQEGSITFETEEGDVPAEAGEVVRFAPGEWKGGTNTGSERTVALLLGSPQDRGSLETQLECPECGDRTLQEIEMTEARDLLMTNCAECGGETGQFTEDGRVRK